MTHFYHRILNTQWNISIYFQAFKFGMAVLFVSMLKIHASLFSYGQPHTVTCIFITFLWRLIQNEQLRLFTRKDAFFPFRIMFHCGISFYDCIHMWKALTFINPFLSFGMCGRRKKEWMRKRRILNERELNTK